MSNLRLLIINGFDIPDALDFAPNSLKYLSLDYSSLKCLPSSFQPKELVHLDLPFSKFEYLWEGEKVILFFYLIFYYLLFLFSLSVATIRSWRI